MNRDTILAIRQLPEPYVSDGTKLVEVEGWIVAFNPNLPPIIWDGHGWAAAEFAEAGS